MVEELVGLGLRLGHAVAFAVEPNPESTRGAAAKALRRKVKIQNLPSRNHPSGLANHPTPHRGAPIGAPRIRKPRRPVARPGGTVYSAPEPLSAALALTAAGAEIGVTGSRACLRPETFERPLLFCSGSMRRQ